MSNTLEKRNPGSTTGVAGGEYLGMTSQDQGDLGVLIDFEHIGTIKTPVDISTVSRKLTDQADQENGYHSGEPQSDT